MENDPGFGNSSAAKNILAHPELADRFEIVEVLGFGSEAFVYLARDRAHGGREVALKLLVDDQVFAGDTMRRFLDEVAVAAEIRHPNLVSAFDIIELDGTVALTMEFVDGVDLAERLRRGSFSFEQTEEIFVQLCSAVEALHARGICHRDLKLENILIRRDGVVKLGDFGLIVRNDPTAPPPSCLLGTPPYMPPEYVEGGAFDVRGDLWALGLVLYEMATGRRRLAGKHGSAALDYLVKTDYRIPTLCLAGLPKKFVRIIERALELDPQKRFQSAHEMRAAMLEESGGEFSETVIKVEPHLELNEYARQPRSRRPWFQQLSLRGVAFGLGVFFVSILIALWVAGGGDSLPSDLFETFVRGAP